MITLIAILFTIFTTVAFVDLYKDLTCSCYFCENGLSDRCREYGAIWQLYLLLLLVLFVSGIIVLILTYLP